MAQDQILKNACKTIIKSYEAKINQYSLGDFMKNNIDPFRFSFNIEIWGTQKAIRKEIEHKLEMALENMIGDFHENYLGNVINIKDKSKWELVPEGKIPGIDIKNTNRNSYLQIKSKHNSLNSSSSSKLAQQLKNLKSIYKCADIGCGWVIASESKKCIGENEISKDSIILKGKRLFSYITGNMNEMDEVISLFPRIIKEISNDIDFDELLNKAARKIGYELEVKAKKEECNIVELFYKNAIGD